MEFFFSINYTIIDSEQIYSKLYNIYSELPDGILLQLNIFDTICNEETLAAWEKISDDLRNCVQYYACPNQKIPSILNHSISISKGRYINFCDSRVSLTSSHLLKLYDVIKKNEQINIFSTSPYKLDDRGKKHHYFTAPSKVYKETDNFINLCLQSYFWKDSCFNHHKFNEDFIFESDFDFIIRTISSEKKYYQTNIDVEIDFIFETDFYNYPNQYHQEWYSQTLKEVYIPLLRDTQKSKFSQLSVCYLIELRFACNRNNRNKNILSSTQLNNFIDICSSIFSKIDDKIIIKYNINNKKLFPKYMCFCMLKIKYKDKNLLPNIFYSKNELYAAFKDIIIERYTNISMEIKSINRSGKNIIIDFEVANTYFFNKKDISTYAKVNSKKIPFIRHSIYSLDKYFGTTMKSGFTGIFILPNDLFKDHSTIEFYLRYKSCAFKLPIRFTKTAARLSEHEGCYWKFGRYIMSYNNLNNNINISKYSPIRLLKKECIFYFSLIKKCFKREDHFTRIMKVILLRIAYWLTKPFIKKEVWLTFDQLFKGGDNGEYFFRYVSEHPVKNTSIYYIINKNCDDSIRLRKKYRNILPYNSFRTRLLALHASYVFATRVDVKQYCGFNNMIEKYFRNLLNYKVLCLQHGLSIQQIAEYQNKIFDNTLYYFCVSEYEIRNLLHPVYGYTKKDLLLTGAPRYDGLISNDKRQILIAPTWRRNVTAGTNRKGEMHAYSINFKDTEYYHIYNRLINDEKLIACAKRCGYRLIYLVHPILSPQVSDFTRNDYVEILAGANGEINYEKILSESSLMITDHSGIQYDFAFMKKPIIYYHPTALPPQYEAKIMDYESIGFGPVCRDHDKVVDTICTYMENKCIISPEYKRRIKSFFAFTDRNNCRRIVESMSYIRSLETVRNTIIARYIAWSLSGYTVKGTSLDNTLAKFSCRLGSVSPALRVKKFSSQGTYLVWTPLDGAKQYRLFRKANSSDNISLISNLSSKVNSFIDEEKGMYPITYRIVAYGQNNITATAELTITEELSISRPEDLHLKHINQDVHQLIWKKNFAATGWNIRYISQQYPKGHRVATLAGDMCSWDIPVHLQHIQIWQVEAFISNGTGTYYSGYANIDLTK